MPSSRPRPAALALGLLTAAALLTATVRGGRDGAAGSRPAGTGARTASAAGLLDVGADGADARAAREALAAADRLAGARLATLDTRARAAQLVVAWIPGGAPPGSAGAQRAERLVGLGVGALIVGKGEAGATVRLLARLRERAAAAGAVPPLVTADLEWGAGMRLLGRTLLPVAMAVGATGDTALARLHARATAAEARAAGIHAVLAPVLDVNVDPRNPIINTRSFGEAPGAVAAFGVATVRGLHEGGVLSIAKHFPGHGDTDADSHRALPLVRGTRARLDSVELPPFRAAARAGLDGVMVGHLAVPALTGDAVTPASLSPALIDGVLRRELAFDGLVMTDALNMAGAAGAGGPRAVVVRAVRAGADLLLQPPDPAGAIDALVRAVEDGSLPAARLEASARRVLRAKALAGLLGAGGDDGTGAVPLAARSAPVAPARLADSIAARSLTLLRTGGRPLPLPLCAAPAAPVASLSYVSVLVPGGANVALDAELAARGVAVRRRPVSPEGIGRVVDSLLGAGGDAPVLVSIYRQAIPWAGAVGLPWGMAGQLERLAQRRPLVLVSFGDPYVAAGVPSAGAVVQAWSGIPAVQRAVARALAGGASIDGRLPVSVPPQWRAGDGERYPAPRTGCGGAR